jgi:hypothetical protein
VEVQRSHAVTGETGWVGLVVGQPSTGARVHRTHDGPWIVSASFIAAGIRFGAAPMCVGSDGVMTRECSWEFDAGAPSSDLPSHENELLSRGESRPA